MAIPRPSKPAVVWRDFRAFMAGGQRHKLLIGLVSILMPALLVAGFYVDSRRDPPKPEMYFLPSWPATRTDAEIIAQQKIDQKKLEERREAKRMEYQRLADKLGIKVDR